MSPDAPTTEPEVTAEEPEAPPPRGGGCATLAAVVLGAGVLVLLGVSVAAWRVRAAPAALTVIAAALPWLWLGAGAFCAAAALAFRRSRRVRLPALACVVVFVVVWGRAWVPWRDGGEGGIVVMSYNVQRLAFEDRAESPALTCVAEAIEAHSPDALALHEVSGRDVDRLEERLGLDCEHIDYKGTERSDRGGLAACARGDRWRIARRGPRRFVDDESWFYIFAELVGDGGVFNLLAVHLQPYGLPLGDPTGDDIARVQGAEISAMLERMARFRDPTIVAGDFNSPRDAAVHVSIRRHMTDAWEQGAWGPGATVRALGLLPLRIDYVYVTDELTVREATIPAVDCADHRPVVVRVGL